jgi:hypothetical protein
MKVMLRLQSHLFFDWDCSRAWLSHAACFAGNKVKPHHFWVKTSLAKPGVFPITSPREEKSAMPGLENTNRIR